MRESESERVSELSCMFTPNAPINKGWAEQGQNQEIGSQFSCGQQGSHQSCHILPPRLHISRKLEL